MFMNFEVVFVERSSASLYNFMFLLSGFINSLRPGGRGNSHGRRENGATPLVCPYSLRLLAKPLITDHETLVKFFGKIVRLHPFPEAFHSVLLAPRLFPVLA